MNSLKLVHVTRLTLVALFIGIISGCTKDTPPTTTYVPPPFDQTTHDVLFDITQNVMLPIVHDFDSRSDSLLVAITALRDQKTDAALTAAKEAWIKVRTPWETCEAFLFGPAKTQQLDPSVDSWPVDQITLDSMLNSSDQFSLDYFNKSSGSVKGAHALEYLMWGSNGQKTASEITDREYEFLVACAQSFHDAASRLLKAWAPTTQGGDDFALQLYNAGKAGSVYTSQAAGLHEVINGLANILNELYQSKMGIPYQNQSTDFEESRYSGNSKTDFLSAVSGVQDVYMGTYSSFSGRGLTTLVAAKSAALDKKIQDKITEVITDLNLITPSFGEAIKTNRNSIQTARTAISDLSGLFSKDVAELLKL